MKEIVIVSCARTAVGRAVRGTLANYHAIDLAASVIEEVVKRANGLEKSEVSDVIIGCAFPESTQTFNIGRASALRAGLPDTVPGQSVTRLCASGLQAIATGAQQIMAGMSEIVIAGGVESMTQVPMEGHHAYFSLSVVEMCPQIYIGMGITAENVARKYGISREEQDDFGLRSNEKALSAIERGVFKDEIVPVEVKTIQVDENDRQVESVRTFDVDECPRRSTPEKMAQLKPVFMKNGTVTAGNSSQMCDAAAAVLLMSADKAKEKGFEPMARYVGAAVAGCPPEMMGTGPIYAVPKVMKLTGLKIRDMDLVEINEAFASQALACIRELGLDHNTTNVNGGAIALGHPLGCTGAKLTVHLLHEMRRRRLRKGLVTMCIGGGQGMAGIFENLS